ncbi:iron donor protein CyaY [Marinicellulosiphila megalodicopiae]|uniref:iron donor protein CyaY n=1 Tax=Marinicellulosiphila megalodicopiae TaxID=2724896 RepID=UPI003BB17CE3
MQRHEFHQLVDDYQAFIEEAIDELDQDLDFDNEAGTLTIHNIDQSQIIISRQSASNQIWVAAKSGGFHFDYHVDKQKWFDDKSNECLDDCINRVLSEQNNNLVRIAFE